MGKQYHDGPLVSAYFRHRYQYNAALVGLFCAAAIFAALYLLLNWHLYLLWLAALSATTFLMVGLDKLLAKVARVRVPETVFHAFTLAGGFPGQWLGRVLFRHKTNHGVHPMFRTVLLAGLLLHSLVAAIIFLS